MVTVMRVSFPVLTHLELPGADDYDVPDLPYRFMGGSAPCQQHAQNYQRFFCRLVTSFLFNSNPPVVTFHRRRRLEV